MNQLKGGIKRTRRDRRDYDHLKTKKLGALLPIPDEYCTDRGLWMPDQNAGIPEWGIPPMPYGCSDYAQADLKADEDGTRPDPMTLEAITNANKNGGTDLRTSFKAVVKLYPKDHPLFFAIRPNSELDWFQAVQTAMVIGRPENRAVSIGTPWFPGFMNPMKGIISYLLTWVLSSVVPWHNWNIKGWKLIDGVPYLIGKPWIGKGYGDGGFCYINRADFNRLMSIPGTAAFILDKVLPSESIETVSMTFTERLLQVFWWPLFRQ